MAKYLNMAIRQAAWLSALAGAACSVHQYAFAQALVDPTRPPTMAAHSADGASSSAGAPVLQSVLISPHRVEAIISGKTVRVGDKVGSAKISKITESEVILRDGKNTQVLKLFPSIEKKRAAITPRALAGDNRQQ